MGVGSAMRSTVTCEVWATEPARRDMGRGKRRRREVRKVRAGRGTRVGYAILVRWKRFLYN
jgi:hypothetical protein